MNLGDILKNVLSLTGDSKPLRFRSAESGGSFFGDNGLVSNWLLKKSGAALTNAEREANDFSANQAQLAYERELAADSTKYQRSVADMQAAGINPMLAVGGVGSSVSAPAPSSVSPGTSDFNLGSLLGFIAQMRGLDIQNKAVTADVANKAADTAKKQSETTGLDIANSIASATKAAQIEAASLRNSLTRSQQQVANKQLDQIEATVKKLSEEAKTEEDKRMYYYASAILSKMNAYNIAEMLPYNKSLATAKTAAERQAAALSAVSAAYKQGLIDNGYIEAFAREMAASAGIAENDEKVSDIKTALRTGDYSKTESAGSLKGDFSSRLLQSLTIALDNLNPLNNIFK